jgi:hypothetical protein
MSGPVVDGEESKYSHKNQLTILPPLFSSTCAWPPIRVRNTGGSMRTGRPESASSYLPS